MPDGICALTIRSVKNADRRNSVGAFVPPLNVLNGQERREGLRFAEDQRFTEVVALRLETMNVIQGEWTVRVKGDYARKVHGQVFDISNASNPVPIDTHVRTSLGQYAILSHFDECSHHGRDADQKRTAYHTCLPKSNMDNAN